MSTQPRLFPVTSETMIRHLGAENAETRESAIKVFCTVYYAPIYGYARAMGFQEADAQDRVQDFFAEVLRRDLLKRYDRQGDARFSSWLITCFKHSVFNQSARDRTQKRGGGVQFVDFDTAGAERGFQTTYLASLDPDPTFDLMLSREVWNLARRSLLQLYAGRENKGLVHDLVPHVLATVWAGKPSQEELAARHGTSAMRLKAFYNRTLKTQARRCFDQSGQLSSPGISDSELDHLWHLLSHYGEA
jgi:DNA-directed RNA polymerase specialized sigma24 family protein